MSIAATSFYVTGGTLQRGAKCYVERLADSEIYDGLMQGRFCYVLTSRQMGKSSLMVRTASRLREEGISVAPLDLTAIGQNLNLEQWYMGLMTQLGARLELEDEIDDFAYEHRHLSPLQGWMRVIREIVLERRKGKVVIFIDEIDMVRSLPFSTDEFLAGIREFYNARSEDPELERLTFCLLGVASPSDLIRDTRTTPFNIGQRVELNDFTKAEAAPLASRLLREENRSDLLLKRILYWTGGHPYLTQKVCKTVAEDAKINSSSDVDRLCSDLFFAHRAQERDDNLLFVRERILRSEADIAGLLELYKQVRRGKRVKDDESNELVTVLRLSGITRAESGALKVRNRIYERVFDDEWIKTNIPDAELRRQRAAFRRGLLYAVSISLAIIAVIAGLAIYAVREARRAEEQRRLAVSRELEKSRLLHVSRMGLIQQAWENADINRVLELLESQIPKPGEEDLRGFEWYYFWRLCHSDLHTFKNNYPVHSIAISPDGKILAASSESEFDKPSKIQLWDMQTKFEILTLSGHQKEIKSIVFSPDGKMLAAGSSDKTIKLWDVSTWRELTSIKGHTGQITSVAFSPDSKLLASGSFDRTVKLWEINTGNELATIGRFPGSVLSVAYSPDGKTLAVGSVRGTTKLWDIVRNKELFVLEGHSDEVWSVAFSPDGKMLATGSLDNTAMLWDAKTGHKLASFPHNFYVRSVAFSPDSKVLATASYDNTLKLWEVSNKRLITAIKGHRIGLSSVAFSPGGNIVATGSEDSTVKLWDLNLRQDSTVLGTEEVCSLAFSPDNKTLATGHGRQVVLANEINTKVPGSVKLWNLKTEQVKVELKDLVNPVNTLSFSPDGKILAAASAPVTSISPAQPGVVRLLDTTTGQELPAITGHADGIFSTAFSPDGKILATGSHDKTVKLWDIASRREMITLTGHTDTVLSLSFSPDGMLLASAGFEGFLKLWDVATGRELFSHKPEGDLAKSVLFSPDGKMLAVAYNNTVKLWDVAARHEKTDFKARVIFMAFSPDGKRLATALEDKTVKLWDISTMQEILTLKGHKDGIFSVAFSPDGKTLATGSWDRTIRLWRAATEEKASIESDQ
jgi:uncharacterized delta-60 repeat protein